MNGKLSVLALSCMAVLSSGPALAFVEPGDSPLADKELRHPGLDPEAVQATLGELEPDLARDLRRDLSVLGIDGELALLDTRGAAWATLWLARPLIPGTGVGNRLTWLDLGLKEAPRAEALGEAAWRELVAFLERHRKELRVDPGELEPSVSVAAMGALIQIHGARRVDGLPVRGAGIAATLNHGNLVLFGTERWGAIDVSTAPRVTAAAALDGVAAHVLPWKVDGQRREPRLEILPLGVIGAVGRGYTHRLAWIVSPEFDGLVNRYEAAVDAHSGELLAFWDTNSYQTARNIRGGVFPVSNDGLPPDGVEAAGFPMPYADVTHSGGTATADSGGNVVGVTGDMTTALAGPFIRMNDNCGPIVETSPADDLDLGVSGGTDCVVPPGHSAGDTHSSRTGFFELNRIVEMALGHWPDPGPANSWLNSQLTANMNINNTCNAFWNGSTVNFYRNSGSQCGNTGEIAGVFDHEWGHGIDDNGTNGGISSPGEGIPDVYAALRLDNSCVGRGFWADGSLCGGYGDPCTPASGCTGIRDIDWEHRTSGVPHDIDWVNGNPNCGSSHCRGYVYSEAIWDLFKRDLPTFYGHDSNTAYEITNRDTFLGADNVSTWYVLTPPGGCGATSGYQQFLGVDDDNGNLADGTPHMQALFSAFDRHQIACPTPTVQDSGCAGGPTDPPVVTIGPADRGAFLSWAPVAGATRYKIFRGDGVFQCDFGKAIVGETTATSFSDTGLKNDHEYSYVVAGFGASDSCMGAASACATVVPVAFLAVDDAEASICVGSDATYTITANEPFVPPVTMSLSGEPAGTTATFDPNPLPGPLPQQTVLTIGNTGGAAAGNYLMTATGDDGGTTFDLILSLDVFDQIPAAPALLSPPDGAVDVSLVPTLAWSASTQAETYVVEVATDPGFTDIVFTAATDETTATPTAALDPVTEYFWHVRAGNLCGDGVFSATFSFTTMAIPPILLVDDDDNNPDVLGTYSAALDAIAGVGGYDLWDTGNSDNEPTALDLAPYDFVVWFTGDEFGGAAGPGAAGEAALADWLDNQGGCLLISSQDYHFDRGLTAFMQSYLGAASVVDDSGDYTAVTGQPGSIFEGQGPYPLTYPFTDWSDIITPDGTALLAFQGNNLNGAAVQKDGGAYKTVFFVYPWEAIAAEADRMTVLETVLGYCAGAGSLIFEDGFESGDTSAWSATVP
ncbi:MAG: hypothetical protein OEP45_01935 [Acidobacteriota bacterium]|nr:hypothetical protein [Acidobacteriota bacterium]